jgi:predicted DNA-binding antitoxin AbrB/MazE fold protein
MIEQTVDAVFENGMFRPLLPINETIAEGQQVQLVIKAPESPTEILELALDVYAGLTEEEITEIEQIALDPQHL